MEAVADNQTVSAYPPSAYELAMRYKSDVPPGEAPDGSARIKHVTVTPEDEKWGHLRSIISFSGGGRYVPAGTYTHLMMRGETMMSDTPDELRDCWGAVDRAKGNCLVTGLGLGCVVELMLRKPEVKLVTVLELNPWVAQHVGNHLLSKYDATRFTVIVADAFTWQPPKGERYDVVFHDIWLNICADNLKEMAKLKRRYCRRADWQGCWCERQCRRGR